MKVYLATSGCYSDYCVESVFSTKEKAEAYIKNRVARDVFGHDWNEIEEYDLDEPLERHKIWYSVHFDNNVPNVGYIGCFINAATLKDRHAYVYKQGMRVSFLVQAETIDKARVVAIERRNAWKAVAHTHTPYYDVKDIICEMPYSREQVGHLYDLNTYEDVSMLSFLNAHFIKNL